MFYRQLGYSEDVNYVNLKLSTVHLILKNSGKEFHEFEQQLFEGVLIPNEFTDVGNFSEYTPSELVRLLKMKKVRLEGCLTNLAYNAGRTRNITMYYLIKAKDALGFGSITEVLWNLREMRSVSG